MMVFQLARRIGSAPIPGVMCVCLHNEGSAEWETEGRMILMRAYHGHMFAGLESVWAFFGGNGSGRSQKSLLLMIDYLFSRGVLSWTFYQTCAVRVASLGRF